MPLYNLEISDETKDIILEIGQRMKLPPSIERIDEVMELVIDALAHSVDSQYEVITQNEGKPLQMQEAINAILNPDISTAYVEPDSTLPYVEYKLTYDDICTRIGKTMPEHDKLTQDAITLVFNELPEDEWNSEHAAVLIEKTKYLLSHEDKRK